jgi:hypothetical protein
LDLSRILLGRVAYERYVLAKRHAAGSDEESDGTWLEFELTVRGSEKLPVRLSTLLCVSGAFALGVVHAPDVVHMLARLL